MYHHCTYRVLVSICPALLKEPSSCTLLWCHSSMFEGWVGPVWRASQICEFETALPSFSKHGFRQSLVSQMHPPCSQTTILLFSLAFKDFETFVITSCLRYWRYLYLNATLNYSSCLFFYYGGGKRSAHKTYSSFSWNTLKPDCNSFQRTAAEQR